MSIVFLLILFLLCIVRMPLSLLAVVLRTIVPFIRARLEFERKNLLNTSSYSFKEKSQRADFCFEVSSEGELEQVRPLMEEALINRQRIEILFSSPSVEAKLEKFYRSYPEHIRLLRLPLLSFWPFTFLYFQNFWWWVTAPVIIFCRYDFFPELLVMKLFGKKFVLVSGATKKLSLYKKLAFGLFDMIIAATAKEAEIFKSLEQKNVSYCDLRVPRIAERISKSAHTLFEHSDAAIVRYCQHIKSRGRNSQLIIGSCWKSDLEIFQDTQLQKDIMALKYYVSLVPHKLDVVSLNEIEAELINFFGRESVGRLSQGHFEKPVLIVDRSGILCELYSLFNVAYVGGGYERSIHSVLEPYVSGSKVICGPRITRSTEYDLIAAIAPDEIHVLKNPLSFYTVFKAMISTGSDAALRNSLLEHTLKTKAVVITAINQL